MKNKILFTFIFAFSINFLSVNAQYRDYTTDSLSMGQYYTNDIFYSMSEGEIASIPRAGWDIAFYTSAFSAGIIINEGAGVELYPYPNGDTSAWNNIDTTGMHLWTMVVNSNEYWEDGAFNRGATGHPDYGWGIYNMVTHSLTGDSLYVIKGDDGEFKKLWIVNKISSENIYNIRFADLDGSNEKFVEIDVKPYTEKNFVYYSISSDLVIDREPEAAWDLLFTKYYDKTLDNQGVPQDYLVTGATNNVDHYANKFYPVGDDFVEWASKPFESLKNTVGYNWKNYSRSTNGWVVEDSTAFFIKDHAGDVYKLAFTFWEGMMTGKFALNKELVSILAIEDTPQNMQTINVYPNPAIDLVNISINRDIDLNGNILITDLSGRIVYSSTISSSDGNKVSINTSNFVKGVYIVSVQSSISKEITKLIIK